MILHGAISVHFALSPTAGPSGHVIPDFKYHILLRFTVSELFQRKLYNYHIKNTPCLTFFFFSIVSPLPNSSVHEHWQGPLAC